MPTRTADTRTYLDRFAALEQDRLDQEPGAVRALRREAIDRFGQLGFPTTKHEEWKYTSVVPIARTLFQPATMGQNGDRPAGVPLAEVDGWRMVFINGGFSPELSQLGDLPVGVRVASLRAALAGDYALIEPHLARYARYDEQTFVALNTALMEDGAFIHVRTGLVLDRPIHVLFLSTAGPKPFVSHPRNLVVLEASSQATVIETYVGLDSSDNPFTAGGYFNNVVTEIVLAENAVADHYKVQMEHEAAFHVATVQIHQERNSNFRSHSFSLGSALTRNDINAALNGPGIESTLNGLYVAGGKQHVDNHTAIHHVQPHCNSHELYKGILDGASTAVFNGKIFVYVDAQKTDAKQTNQNLLLSRNATINTKPQLQIYADDVRCTHGATVGQLDDDAVFYLRSRGVGLEQARTLLTFAFASDITGRVKVESLRRELEKLLLTRLPGGPGLRGQADV